MLKYLRMRCPFLSPIKIIVRGDFIRANDEQKIRKETQGT